MARRSGRKVTVYGSATYSVARSAAASYPVPIDEPQFRSSVSRSTSVARRANRRAATVHASQAIKRPSGPFSFGAWSFPPSLSLPEAKKALSCARRGRRKEVLFAKKLTGAGSHARKRHYSNRSCK